MPETLQPRKITWNNLRTQATVFATNLHTALTEIGILNACKDLKMDHICVRLKNESDVRTLKTELEAVGKVISAAHVNGREISIVQLDKALDLDYCQTYGIELPYPKPNHQYADGWEHVEFVLPDTENTLDGIRDAFMTTFPTLDHDQLVQKYAYTEDEPQAASDQLPNPTVGIKVNGIGIKFHAYSIQTVVGYK